MCPLYVAGLIGPGDRKSVGPMAERVAPGDYDRLHHFVSGGVWDEAPLERELALQGDKLVGGADAFLVIDDTALPKKGTHSVGVGPQYAWALGKTANCQTLVSLTLARGEVPVMVGLRLFLPESWTGDEVRLERTGVPAEYRPARTKSEIALAELDRLIAAGVRFGTVLADAGYGMGAEFRQALSARSLAWAVGAPRHQKVYPREVELVFPVAGRGHPRKRHVPNVLSVSAEDMLTHATWRTLAWRKGTKGLLKARFAAVRVRVADGPHQRIGDKGMQHMPGEEVWLVGERRASSERKYYLANLPPNANLKTLAATIHAGLGPGFPRLPLTEAQTESAMTTNPKPKAKTERLIVRDYKIGHQREIALVDSPAKDGGLFPGAGGLGRLRLRGRHLQGRRSRRGPCSAGLHGAHPGLTQEGVPLLLCAVKGVLVDVAADARDPAVGLILPEMPGARAVLHGRMVFGRAHPDRIVRQRAVGKICLVEIEGRIDDRPLAVMALHLLQHDLHVGDGLVLGDMAAAGR